MTFIYSQSKVRDRKLLEKAIQLSQTLQIVDIEREKLSSSHFSELALPRAKVKELLDPRLVEGYELKDAEEVLSLINRNPELLKTPVVVTPRRMHYIKDLSDLQYLFQKVEVEDRA